MSVKKRPLSSKAGSIQATQTSSDASIGPVNPAERGDVAEKAWACLCRNKTFLAKYRAWRRLGAGYLSAIDGSWGALADVFRELEVNVTRVRFFQGESPPAYDDLSIDCRELLKEIIESIAPSPVRISVSPEAEECALVFSLDGSRDGDSLLAPARYDAATRLGLDVARLSLQGYVLFAAPRPLDAEHAGVIFAEFKKCLAKKEFSKSAKNCESSLFMGSLAEWRDYLHYRWFREYSCLNEFQSLCAASLLLANAKGERLLYADWGSFSSAPASLTKKVLKYQSEAQKILPSLTERIGNLEDTIKYSFDRLFPKARD